MKTCFLTTLILSALTIFGLAQEMSMSLDFPAEHIEFFEKKIRPALSKHCYECHSEQGDKIRGGLLLDTRKAALQGGDSGPAVVPHNPGESLLYVAISYEDDSLEMPPKYQLPKDVVSDFKRWIELGAPDPRVSDTKPTRSSTYTNTIDVEKGRAEHWAYQKPVMPPPIASIAKGTDWAKHRIDEFIINALSAKGMTPSDDADPATLLRRISFDLLGLPPSPQMIRSFVSNYPNAPEQTLETTIDKLLASPQFGERWGRHWLDVARYAESSGKESNATFPYAWRYRDWVIDSFNADKPFDEMITEQLAGDLIEKEEGLSPGDKTIATGFLALGVKGLNERNVRQFRFDVADEQIDTTTRAFLATTVACSRCHDHKFDPIPMSDYYAMAGIFLSSETLFGTANAVQNRHQTELITLPTSYHGGGRDRNLAEMIEADFQLASLRERVDQRQTEIREARQAGDNEEASRLRAGLLGLTNQVQIRSTAIRAFDLDGKLIPRAMGMADRSEPFDSQILIRGEEDNATSERVARGLSRPFRPATSSTFQVIKAGGCRWQIGLPRRKIR